MSVYLVYPLLLFLLFYGSKLLKRGEWNSNYLSLEQTKAFLGFCSVLIVFHHISQKTCDHNLDQFSVELRPGLELFVFVGYLCVAMFFFCSGYGMYISSQKGDSFNSNKPLLISVLNVMPSLFLICCSNFYLHTLPTEIKFFSGILLDNCYQVVSLFCSFYNKKAS